MLGAAVGENFEEPKEPEAADLDMDDKAEKVITKDTKE